MRRTLVLVPLLVLACDRSPTPTELQPAGGSAAIRPEFGLEVSPTELAVERGASASATVTIARSTNFRRDVTLTLAGLPEGVTATFDPQVTDGDASIVTFAAAASAPLGTSTVTITGQANGHDTRTTTLQLTVVRPLIPIALDFCASDAPLWFAFQNEGEPWTQVVPDANATVFFRATETVGIAFTRGRRSSLGAAQDARITSVLYVTTDELRPLNGATCRNEFGSKVINGSFSGLVGGDNGVVSLHLVPFQVSSFSPTFRATGKPDEGALDLIASRLVAGEPASFIVRRGLVLANEEVVPALDFASSEAVPADVPPYTVSGLRGSNDQMTMDFWTGATRGGLPSYQRLSFRFGAALTTTGTYRAVPASLLAPGDRHELTIRTGSNADVSGVTSVFQNAGPLNLAIGPSLNMPTFEQVPGSSPPRFRVAFASQSEYGATARLIAFSSNVFTVEATTAYHGSTPATWELEMPDFTAVSGWNTGWTFTPGENVILDASAWSMAAVDIPALWISTTIPPWSRPFADGSMVQFAGRRAVRLAQGAP